METETHNGIEGRSKAAPKHQKRMRTKSTTDPNQEMRKVSVPAHRYTPLKENWLKIFTPIVEHLHLQIRFNLKTRNVEIRTCKETPDVGNLQKAADFVKVIFNTISCFYAVLSFRHSCLDLKLKMPWLFFVWMIFS